VTVAATAAEARVALAACFEGRAFGAAGEVVVLEERLDGEEASLMVVTDGERHLLLPGARDHKRALDGDRGPNTGGMGATSPAPALDPRATARVEREIVRPTLEGMAADGIPYRGLLYVGLMLTADGPRVVEYNARFGDPETQAVLPRLGGDLALLLQGAARGRLDPEARPPVVHPAAACVVIATRSYPAAGDRGLPVSGVAEAEAAGAIVFHAGTAEAEGRLVTAGGRVLNVVGTGDDPGRARERAYAGAERIRFEGARYRLDIGRRAPERST
jgi:phosphoribosylamine--glycine ligase